MNQILKKFDIFNIDVVEEKEDNPDFALAEFWFLADGNNSHHNPISTKVLKEYANTVLGKFVVCEYDEVTKDVMTHTLNEQIVGFVPPNAEVRFEEKQGKTFAIVNAVLSKFYAKNIVDMFKQHNNRSVSVEFSVFEGEEDAYGDRPIEKFNIHGITILGMNVNPSVRGADMKVLQFSENKAQEYYNCIDTLSQLKKLAKNVTYKVDKSKEAMVDESWGDVDKTELRNKIMEASNRSTLVKSVYLVVEKGWEDAPSEHLKYPIMQFKGDTLVYNRNGLSSALGYAKAENDKAIVKKVESIYKKLGLDGEEDMSKKNFEIEGREAWGKVIAKVQDHEGEGAYVDSIEKDHIIFTKDGVRYHVDANVEVGEDDKTVDAEIKWDTIKEDVDQKEFSEEEKEVECAGEGVESEDAKEDTEGSEDETEELTEEKEEEYCGKMSEETEVEEKTEESEEENYDKEFSYDMNVDLAAYNAMLEEETDDYKEIIKEFFECKDMNILMSKYLSAIKERDELKTYKDAKEAKELKESVDTLLCEAKQDLTEDKYTELFAMSKEVTKDTLTQFVNTVKAFAYDCSKEKEDKNDHTEHIQMRTFEAYVEKKIENNVNAFYAEALNK